MSESGILITVAGENVDLDKVTWYIVTPCGCTRAALVAFSDYGPPPALVIATADQALAEFADSKAELEKYTRLGFTAEAGLRAEITTRMGSDGCTHEPKWGYTIPGRHGMTWAIGGYHGSRTSVLHLVDELAASQGYMPATALCGQSQHHWTDDSWEKGGKVECTRCMKKATAAVAEAVSA